MERKSKARLSNRIRCAIEQMIDFGRSRSEAAEVCGITDDWLYRELRRPEVLAYRRERMEVLRTSEAARSIAKIALLMDTAQSEAVQCEAAKWLASLDGIAPSQCAKPGVHARGTLGPGLVIVTTPAREMQRRN